MFRGLSCLTSTTNSRLRPSELRQFQRFRQKQGVGELEQPQSLRIMAPMACIRLANCDAFGATVLVETDIGVPFIILAMPASAAFCIAAISGLKPALASCAITITSRLTASGAAISGNR